MLTFTHTHTGQEYSKPSDVYAVGLILWEILTRRHPYDHLGSQMNEVKVKQKVPSNDPDNRPPISEEAEERGGRVYCDLVRECWSGDPMSRPSAEKVSEKRKKWEGDRERESYSSFKRSSPRSFTQPSPSPPSVDRHFWRTLGQTHTNSPLRPPLTLSLFLPLLLLPFLPPMLNPLLLLLLLLLLLSLSIPRSHLSLPPFPPRRPHLRSPKRRICS